MVEDRGGMLGATLVYKMTVCSEVPSSIDDPGVEGNKMEVVLEVSFELMDALCSWPGRS